MKIKSKSRVQCHVKRLSYTRRPGTTSEQPSVHWSKSRASVHALFWLCKVGAVKSRLSRQLKPAVGCRWFAGNCSTSKGQNHLMTMAKGNIVTTMMDHGKDLPLLEISIIPQDTTSSGDFLQAPRHPWQRRRAQALHGVEGAAASVREHAPGQSTAASSHKVHLLLHHHLLCRFDGDQVPRPQQEVPSVDWSRCNRFHAEVTLLIHQRNCTVNEMPLRGGQGANTSLKGNTCEVALHHLNEDHLCEHLFVLLIQGVMKKVTKNPIQENSTK